MVKAGIAPLPVRAARPMPGRGLPDLPQFYYHTNFCELLDFVAAKYESVLGPEHLAFVDDFYDLPRQAQYAYCRLVGRRGQVFDTGKLKYPEIRALNIQWETLSEAGFTAAPGPDDFEAVLQSLTKPDLADIMADLCPSLYKKSWKKPDLIEVAKTHLDFDAISLPGSIIMQARIQALRFILFLYFGKIEDSLQSFTLRDLGLVKAAGFKTEYEARFDCPHDARTAYFYAGALSDFHDGPDDAVTRLIDSVDNWPAARCEISTLHRDKLLRKLGGLSERLGDIETALSLYARSETPLCNERVIRLRYARNQGDDRDWVKTRLERLMDDPGSDEECQFAQDFYARKYDKKRTSGMTDLLRGASVLKLDESFRNAPERAAQKYYDARGQQTWRTENRLWKTLFGLTFWEELFESGGSGLHSDFDRMPAGLRAGTFYSDFKDRIESKLAGFDRPDLVHVRLLKTYAARGVTSNSVFRKSARSMDAVAALLKNAPGKSIAAMLRMMAQEYRNTKDGFPDLMRVEPGGGVTFIEIKAEGDVLRRNQLTRLAQLEACGFQAEIARVNWIVDPSQIYVVVDVETTGGRAATNRLTEIGAVKMQGGEIIGEWSSLLNPQRPIPPNITRITNITDGMVAGAPLFRDIAGSFGEFMGDGIFAAHNVNFDYGFISEEYRRIERSFRFAKICTCASMRKLYPGYKSYSLKNLCREFEIDLTSHHRALCDAQAAAELLKLVNIRRAENAA